jgi:serine/threonine protein kinase/Tol biopolymer transport system component
MKLEKGTTISHYKILSQIGAGGMGDVYVAEDKRLHRKLALKVLPADVASNKDRMRRFNQEAVAAAALNHPNIAHVYEIGESDGVHFIAMEFIDGVTLRDKIHRDRPGLRKVLGYLQNVATALAKAHAAGIVHRDLKPENIMVTNDNYTKILDFGLAKLVEPDNTFGTREPAGSETATALLQQHSLPGTILGTVGYMSPEQAQGRINEIDHRSDIFSFGCILFEAATGQKAFEGKDVIDSLHKIVHTPTPQIRDFNPNAPADLQRIVRRCLAKEPDKRYQSIKDVAIEIEDLRQELKAAADPDSSASPSPVAEMSSAGSQPISTDSPVLANGGTAQIDAARTTSSAEYLVSQVKEHKKGVLIGLGILVPVIVGAAFGIYKFAGSKQAGTAPSFESMKITKLTDTGAAGDAAISPDGKYVVHVKQDAGQESLWVRHIGTGSNVQIIPPAEVEYGRLTFSPDGGYIYFPRRKVDEENRALYQVPVLGGEPTELNSNVGSTVTFSPDGKRIAFVRGRNESTIIVANADGTGEQPLATLKRPEFFKHSGPAWSPDGTVIAVSTGATDDSGRYQRIVEIRVEDGTMKPIGSSKWADCGQVAWLANGSGVIANNFYLGSNISQVYQISYPGGEVQKITNDLLSYHGISLTADSNSIVVVQEDRVSNIWSAPDGDTSRPKQLTRGSAKYEGRVGLRWTPDGRIVFTHTSGLAPHIWIMDEDGSSQRQLNQSIGIHPSVSPDGRYVVFSAQKGGVTSIWRMDIDGGNQRQLASDGVFPSFSPDGLWITYTGIELPGEPRMWRVSIDGGDPVRLTDYLSSAGSVSPDGKSIAAIYREQRDSPARLAIIPFEGGQPTKLLDLPPGYNTVDVSAGVSQRPHWLPDGRSLAYIVTRNGVSNIWSIPIDGGEPKQLTDFTTYQIAWFDLSPDGKPNLFSRGATTKDVVLISGFRK